MSNERECQEALEYATRMVEDEPADGVSWILKGNCHLRLEQLEEAVEAYRRAVLLGEVRSHANFFMGSCLVELGRFSEAEAPLRAQLAISPDHADALFLLGLVLRTQDQREESDSLLERIRDFDTAFYEEMFAKYATLLAEESDNPMMAQALRDAARALRKGT